MRQSTCWRLPRPRFWNLSDGNGVVSDNTQDVYIPHHHVNYSASHSQEKARKSDSTEGESPSRCRRVGSQMDRCVTAQAPQVYKSTIQPFLSRSSKGGTSLESHDNNVRWVRCVRCKLGVSPDCDRAFEQNSILWLCISLYFFASACQEIPVRNSG